MLNRLGVRQKLALLLLVPLAAVLLTLVPFTTERIGDATAAGVTARAADAAREVGVLVQDLQQERLLALGFLTTTQLDRSALLAKAETVVDEAARLRAAPGTAAVLARASNQLSAVAALRPRLVVRAVDAAEAYAAYRELDTALLDALRLVNPAGVDAEGLRQLSALDALMRANEEASSVGAVLVAVAGDRRIPRSLLSDALAAQGHYTRRFRQLVNPSRIALLDLVEQGKAGQRINDLIRGVNSAPGAAAPMTVVDALTAAVSYTGLRRVAQDRIAREIAAGADQRARAAGITAAGVGGGAGLLFIVMVVLGVTVSRSIAVPIRRLTRAAVSVADLTGEELRRVSDSDDPDRAPPRLAAVEVHSDDEVGALAVAFNRVQTTAALLLERQFQARRNVAVMFGNIARRTQNLVGRQIVLLEALQDGERRPDLLARYYRLDHLATRLRRSADSLLVLAGATEQGLDGAPTLLVDVVHAALADVESPDAVRARFICDISVSAGLAADLRLLLAELIENAANFSPPGVPVDVSAQPAEDCRIEIVDRGLGMTATKLAEENQRLVERERLDVAPTTMLGLFVVGRLARRHGLRVQLEPTPGGGTTAVVTVPPRLLAPASAARAVPRPRLSTRFDRPLAAPLELTSTAFAWFGGDEGPGAAGPPGFGDRAGAAGPAARVPSGTGQRAAPALGTSAPALGTSAPANGTTVDAAGAAGAQPLRPTRGGLTRRTPGTHLLPIHGQTPSGGRVPGRDPMAERAALDSFVAGAARGGRPPEQVPAPVSAVPSATSAGATSTGAAPSGGPGTAVQSGRPAEPPATQPGIRSGFTRRVPGAHLAPSTFAPAAQNPLTRGPAAQGRFTQPPPGGPDGGPVPPSGGHGGTPAASASRRDPEAERDALNGFLAGFARGAGAATEQQGQSHSERRA